MRVIFLDIDGVMVSTDYINRQSKNGHPRPGDDFDPRTVRRLNAICDKTGAKIVITSTWRIGLSLKELKNKLLYQGVPPSKVIGMVPVVERPPNSKEPVTRGVEINSWLNRTRHELADKRDPVDRFIIIDDDADMAPYLDKLIQVSEKDGLQDEHVTRAIMSLGG